MKVARAYLRVSTKEQDLQRQDAVIEDAKAAGYYIAAIYREKASGARADRPELLRMIDDLQPGEIVIAEKIDRISRLPLAEAEKLISAIRTKGAKLAIPGVVDLSEIAGSAQGTAKIVLDAIQDMLLKLALQMSHDNYQDYKERQTQGIKLAKDRGEYKGRSADIETHKNIIELRKSGQSIAKTAKILACSESQVKRIWAIHKQSEGKEK